MIVNMDETILELHGIRKSFASVRVLEGVDLTLKRGKVLGVVGENGAGKSTLMNILGGIIKRDSGEMLLEGAVYEPKNPNDAKKKGISFIHQELSLFGNLSVKENLFIDGLPTKGGVLVNYPYMSKRAKEALALLGVRVNVDKPIDSYSMGIRQMVEIAKSLLRDTRVLIFDEPTTSLSQVEKEDLFKVIGDLTEKGVSIIYISHVLEDVFALCEDICVIRDGKVIGQKPASRLDKDAVVKMMVGREITDLYPYIQKNPGKDMLKIEDLTSQGKFEDVSFDLRQGEIVGMFGLVGAGRSEVARAIFGVDPYDSGSVSIEGEAIAPTPQACIAKGVAFVTENRKEEGVLLTKSIQENLTLVDLDGIRGKFASINKAKERSACKRIIDLVKIKTYDPAKQEARQLSGGNQQKVVIGKWLMKAPRVFIMDEPTRGVDVGAKFEIYNYINDLAAQNTAVLIISSEMEELMGICDRILVLSKGRLTGEMKRGDYTQQAIMEYAVMGG